MGTSKNTEKNVATEIKVEEKVVATATAKPETEAKADAKTPKADKKASAKKVVVSNASAMLPAIIAAHNDNNRRAIDKEDYPELNISDQSYAQWEAYVDYLREAAVNYQNVSNAKDSTAKDLTAVEGALFAAWKDVMKNGISEKYDKQWFVRKTDVSWLFSCVKKDVNTSKGANYGHRSRKEFRRGVERLIGCRLASNEILTAEEVELIQKYEGSERNIKSQNNRLNGTQNKIGLLNKLALEDKKFSEKEALMVKLSIEKEQIMELLAGDLAAIAETKNSIKAARKSISESEAYLKENKEAYDKLMESVKELEA